MPYAAVSSFSLHSRLGPLHLERRDEQGVIQPMIFGFPKQHSLEEFGQIAHDQLGVQAIELCQLQFDAQAETEARIDELRGALDRTGVKVLTMPIDVGDLTTESDAFRADDVARIERWFEIAHRLGADYVRVNAGAPVGGAGQASKGAVGALQRLSDRAKTLGMILLVENHGGLSSDPNFMLQLLDQVGHDRLGLLLDLGNFEPLISISHGRFAGNEPPSAGIDMSRLYESVEQLAPVASLVHAKAIDPASDGSPLLDLPKALGIVAASGYAGSVSVEWEGQLGDPWEQTAATLATVRSIFPALH
ncbi:sugar phosphate isomerase/epimerase family protein [Rhizorhabdus argentea]|uniref:sugar phosphate isomerase/epimerase family protein n=1 Tax=Rhizorhabdus argentea TaxID=1387174 RepID=UPI0030ED360D